MSDTKHIHDLSERGIRRQYLREIDALKQTSAELLEALVDLTGLIERHPRYFNAGEVSMSHYIEASRAAIAKAKGEDQ